MGGCQSTPSADDEANPPSVTPKRESQPYGSSAPTKEEVAPRSGKAPEGPRSGSTGKSKSDKSPGKEKAKDKDSKNKDKPSSKSKSDKKSKSDAESPASTSTALVIRGSDAGAEGYDGSRWKLKQFQFNGSTTFKEMGKKEIVQGQSVQSGIDTFKANPEKYIAMIYQTNMVTDNWPANQCQFVLQHREGTVNYAPKGISPDGQQTILMHEYECLPPFPNNDLPMKYRDKWTDNMTHNGQLIHTQDRKPILPGRGMGVCDEPNLKIIGDVDPSDIHQGGVGNCWLLSGISALAEFDGAIKKLFRKTKNFDQRPLDEANMYTITLWDLATWKEVGKFCLVSSPGSEATMSSHSIIDTFRRLQNR